MLEQYKSWSWTLAVQLTKLTFAFCPQSIAGVGLPCTRITTYIINSIMASSSSSSFTREVLTNPRGYHFDWSIVVLKNGVHTVFNVELHSGMTGTTTMHAIRKAYRDTNPTILWFHSRSILEDATISSVSCLFFNHLARFIFSILANNVCSSKT